MLGFPLTLRQGGAPAALHGDDSLELALETFRLRSLAGEAEAPGLVRGLLRGLEAPALRWLACNEAERRGKGSGKGVAALRLRCGIHEWMGRMSF